MSQFDRFTCPSCSYSTNDLDTLVAHVSHAGHGRPFENGNAIVGTFHHDLLGDRKNVLWEVWDFVDRKLVGEYETERECVSRIETLYSEKFDRVRYLVHAPHNVLLFPGPRPPA